MANPYRACFRDPGVAGVPSQHSQAFGVPVLAHLSTEPSPQMLNLNNLEKKAQTQEMFANHVSDLFLEHKDFSTLRSRKTPAEPQADYSSDAQPQGKYLSGYRPQLENTNDHHREAPG